MLNTIHLQTFLAVVEAGNYSAAAERLHMSQPAVSQHIRALERYLDNVRLFRRVGQQMALTHAGEELVDVAREMLALSARAEENIRVLRGQISGRVTIGCTPSSGEQLLSSLLASFHMRFPAIAVTVTIAPLETLLDWLATQQAQILLIEEQQRRRGWESQLLGVERLALLAPRGHALLQQEQVPPGLLRGLPLVLPLRGSPLRRIIEDGLRRRSIGAADITVALETEGMGLMVQAVRDGLGLAFVPQMRPRHRRGRPGGREPPAGVVCPALARARRAPRRAGALQLHGQQGRTQAARQGRAEGALGLAETR
jgi:DNA-binding transcriptional LysR family regulator